MSFTFVSNSGGSTPIGTIILWYGTKAAIPAGWAYYAQAAGLWVMGATSANTTPQNTSGHTHAYANPTGSGGDHTHSFTVGGTSSAANNSTTIEIYTEGTWDGGAAMTNHTHGVSAGTIGGHAGHTHALLTSGSTTIEPASVGIYYIRRTV